jgi:adenylate kinase family enzyme
MKYRGIPLLGAPGAGKGTQGKILGAIPNFFHCSCGEVFRSLNIEGLVRRLQRRALKENRPDDANVDVIRHRLKTYEKETKPVLDFYGKRLVHRINADQTPAQVLFDILRPVAKP